MHRPTAVKCPGFVPLEVSLFHVCDRLLLMGWVVYSIFRVIIPTKTGNFCGSLGIDPNGFRYNGG